MPYGFVTETGYGKHVSNVGVYLMSQSDSEFRGQEEVRGWGNKSNSIEAMSLPAYSDYTSIMHWS